MSTYSWPIEIRWGAGAAPSSAKVNVGGTEQTPTLTTAITELPTGSGRYYAVATYDTAWGAVRDWWYDASGLPYPGDGPLPNDVRFVVGETPTQVTSLPGGVGTGTGDNPITQDGGPGVTVNGVAATTDCLRFTLPGGVGADNVEVVAYLKSDYDAGAAGPDNRKGATFTGTDGRWAEPLMLDSGTYTIVANKSGYQAVAETVVVP